MELEELTIDEVVLKEEVELEDVVGVETTELVVVVVDDLLDRAKAPAPAIIMIITTTTTIIATRLIARLNFLGVKL